MAEPTASSPPSPASLPPPDPVEAMTKASPEDFLAALPSSRDAAPRSGDSPPPPERKQYDNHSVSSASASCPPPSDRKQVSTSDASAGGGSGAIGPPPPPGTKPRRDRYGLGGSSNNGPMKFQFYVPTPRSSSSSQEGGNSGGLATDSTSENSHHWGSNRSGGGGSNNNNTSDHERISDGRGGGGGGNGLKIQTPTGGGGGKKGIDPPEHEPPTPMTAEESARKARSRLIQLQHRESHASVPPHREPPAAPHSHNVSAMSLPQGGGGEDGSANTGGGGRRSRAGTGSGSSFGGLDSIDDENVDVDEDDDYPHMNMDPIESDDEDPVSDHFDDEGPPSDAGLNPSDYQSPLRPNASDQQHMKKQPSSAPQRPSHRLPPQQLMQYLHAGRGSFGRQGGGGGGGNAYPLPHSNNNNGPPIQQQQPQQPLHPNHLSQQHPSRHSQFGQQQHYQQQHHQQLQQQHHRNYNQPRRTSDLYSDGINLLEKAASEAREREEVDTLKDGINYLRNLETALEMGDDSSAKYVGEEIAQYSAPNHLPRSLNVGSMAMPDQQSSGNIVSGGAGGTITTMEQSTRNVAPPPYPPPPPLTNRPHRPPPKTSKTAGQQQPQGTRGSSAGDDVDKLVAQISNAKKQQQPQGGQLRTYHPPPPRQQVAVATTPTQVRKRPIITAAAAMDFVMSASARPPLEVDLNEASDHGGDDRDGEGNREGNNDGDNSHQVAADINKMHTFLNAMMEDGEEGVSVGASGKANKLQASLNKKMGSFDSVEEGSDDSELSGAVSVDSQGEDFESNTSLSMHAEAKFGSSQYGSSRYAEDKHGMPDQMLSQMERLHMDDDDSPRRTSSRNEQQRSMDPPTDDNHDGHNIETNNERNANNVVSPSVLPMRTMNERLYAVEAIIPTPTPTRYHHNQQELFADEVDSFDRVMPRMVTHEDATRKDVPGEHPPPLPSHALGPRSNRPGGTTGVVLDMSSDGDNNREYTKQRSSSLGRERSRTEGSSDSSSSSAVSVSSSDIESSSSESEDDQDPQDSLADGRPLDGASHGEMDKYSWGVEVSGEPEATGLVSSSSQHPSTSLMMNLCSHLLPTMDTSNSLSFLQNNKQSRHLVWDDEDPDEPGYVIHHLTSSQLVSVENAFEKIVSLLDRKSSQELNGSNKNFERDLEEAELILDQEEKRYESEVVKNPSLSREEDSYNKSDGQELQVESQESDVQRESVPDFPGIYPPGKGKAGEMECFYLPIITKSQKTGFEPTKDLVLKSGSVFANNYLVQSELGSAAFSTAYRCLDLSSEEDEDGYQDEVCLKVIKNTKDYFDQSLDEIKILQLLKDTGRVHENNVVEMKSYFYHREHLVIVTELLRQNLYEFGKSILESRGPLYFTRMRLSHITRQCLISLKFVHELGLMHCDIKPENILLSSYSRALVKVIDFGSSSFITDRQSSYIQSRSYRAPEVILGLPYGGKIDMWSLGCVVAELYTNEVTFQNDSELSMLSRIEAICGPFPRHMIAKGRNSHRIFTDSGLIYEKVASEDVGEERSHGSSDDDDSGKTLFNVYQPKMTTIAARLGFEEDFMDQPKVLEDDENRALFVDFVSKLLTIDPDARVSAAEALNHPWIKSSLDLTEDDIRYGP